MALSLLNVKELNADHNHEDMNEDETENDDDEGMQLQYYSKQKNY